LPSSYLFLSTTLKDSSSKFTSSQSRALQQQSNATVIPAITTARSQGIVRIICGRDNAIIDRFGRRWSSDSNRTFITPLLLSNQSNYTGHKYNLCSQRTTLFSNDTNSQILCSERYFNPPNDDLLNKTMGYNIAIPVPSPSTSSSSISTVVVTTDCVVHLHFAELFSTQIGQRIFDIFINGQIVLSNLDILSNTNVQRYVPYQFNSSTIKLTHTFNTSSTSNVSIPPIITLGFRAKTNHPKINAIEIIWNATTMTTTIPTTLTTMMPTIAPIMNSSVSPISIPSSKAPTKSPIATSALPVTVAPVVGIPTLAPTKAPIAKPTLIPTSTPTSKPSSVPTSSPTSSPTSKPSTTSPVLNKPSTLPTTIPITKASTKSPIATTTKSPVLSPTSAPAPKSTSKPVSVPTLVPGINPAVPSMSPLFPSVRINAGGPTVIDSMGRVWVSDADDPSSVVQIPNATGSTYSICSWTPVLENRIYQPSNIPGSIMCSERYFNPWIHPGPYRYQITMKMNTSSSVSSSVAASNGTKLFNVTLHFVEIYHTTVNGRVFDVAINQMTSAAFTDIDIINRTSSTIPYSLLSISTTIPIMNCHPISGCLINIDLKPKVDYPKISAIEITDITPNTNNNSTLEPKVSPSLAPTKAPTKKVQLPTKTNSPSVLPSLPPIPVQSNKFQPIRINVGGTSSIIDKFNNTWIADTDLSYHSKGGLSYDACANWIATPSSFVSNSSDIDAKSGLFCSERYFNQWEQTNPTDGPLSYNVTIVNKNSTALYTVRLLFAENYFTESGKRVFDVYVQGQIVFSDFDIIQAAGSKFHVYDLTLSDPVSAKLTGSLSSPNGTISIVFVPIIENPKLSAIVITEYSPVASPPIAPTIPTKAPIVTSSPVGGGNGNTTNTTEIQSMRINVGGTSPIIDKFNNTWIADTDLSYHSKGGLSYDACANWIATPSSFVSNSSDIDAKSGLFCSERYFNQWEQTNPTDGPLSYNITIAQNALYNVRLFFVESYFMEPGKRIFDVYVQGKIVLSDFDIIQTMGSKFHVYDVTVSDPVRPSGIGSSGNGTISIVFTPIIENPKLSAIEITEYVPSIPASVPTMAPIFNVKTPTAMPSTSPAQPVVNTSPPTKLLPTSSPTIANTTNGTLIFQPILINCGNTLNDYIDWKGQVWMSEKPSSNNPIYHNDAGFTYGDPWKTISNTQSPELYQTERFGVVKYDIPVEEANYEIILHFAEVSIQNALYSFQIFSWANLNDDTLYMPHFLTLFAVLTRSFIQKSEHEYLT
jgi:Malectin domain